VRKAIKYNFAFCAAGGAEERGTFDSVLNLKYFIQAVKLPRPTQKLLWPPNFPSFSSGFSETLCIPHLPWGAIWPTLISTVLEDPSFFFTRVDNSCSFNLTMEPAVSYATKVNISQTIRRHMPEDS